MRLWVEPADVERKRVTLIYPCLWSYHYSTRALRVFNCYDLLKAGPCSTCWTTRKTTSVWTRTSGSSSWVTFLPEWTTSETTISFTGLLKGSLSHINPFIHLYSHKQLYVSLYSLNYSHTLLFYDLKYIFQHVLSYPGRVNLYFYFYICIRLESSLSPYPPLITLLLVNQPFSILPETWSPATSWSSSVTTGPSFTSWPTSELPGNSRMISRSQLFITNWPQSLFLQSKLSL